LDDERSLRGLAGSSTVLSTSVPGFSYLLHLKDDTCLPDDVSLGTNNGKNNDDGKYKNKKLNLITTKEETIAQLIADGERWGQR
jgi:hypothetical protein